MSINLSGKTLSLKTNIGTNPNIPVIASLMSTLNGNDDQGLTTEEGSIAFANKDTSLKYSMLRGIGLNNLRSEIIAICEFIPLVTNNNNDSAKAVFRYGEDAQLRVTNVSRLIELQRQIRSYLVTAAEKILENVYSNLYREDFIEQLKDSVKQHAKNLRSSQAASMESFTQS